MIIFLEDNVMSLFEDSGVLYVSKQWDKYTGQQIFDVLLYHSQLFSFIHCKEKW